MKRWRICSQSGCFEGLRQPSLAGQDNLHQLSGGRFEVRQHADGFECVAMQILSFIEYDDDCLSSAFSFDQVLVKQLVARRGRRTRLQTQGREDGVQNSCTVIVWVRQVGDLGLALQHLDQGEQDSGFAQASAAQKQSKTAALLDGIEKCGYGFAVLLRLEEEAAVGRDTEGLFAEAEVGDVHEISYTDEYGWPRQSVPEGSGQDGKAGDLFQFARLLDGIAEVFGRKGNAKTEEACQEDS